MLAVIKRLVNDNCLLATQHTSAQSICVNTGQWRDNN